MDFGGQTFASAYDAASAFVSANSLFCCITIPLSLVKLRYRHLETVLMADFGMLALGLRRQATLDDDGDGIHANAYVSADPNPNTRIRPGDCVFVLRSNAD